MDAGQLLDDQLLTSDQDQRMLVIVRVLVAVLLQELVAWSAICLITLVLPLIIGPNTAPTLCLVLLLCGLATLILSYCILLAGNDRLLLDYALGFFLLSMALVVVNTAILIHATAATSFVIMLWLGALIVMLRLVHTPAECAAPIEFAWLMGGACLCVCLVCTLQELALTHALANFLALVLGLMCTAFRWDWLAHHALASESTYNLKDVPTAWTDMYTWTCRTRLVQRCAAAAAATTQR